MGGVRSDGQDARAAWLHRPRAPALAAVARAIHEDVCSKAFDPELGSFVQAYGSKALDASLLLLPLVGFLPPTDPRIIGTVAAIERRLVVDGFVVVTIPERWLTGCRQAKEHF